MELTADIVARVARRLAEHAGMELPAWVVEARAAARIADTGLAPADYVELIGSGRGAGELAALVEAVRVGETSLFRHRQQFAMLTDTIAPRLRAQHRRVVQVWSAGCATGQEPYSLAIVLARALPDLQISIVATDLSEPALATARANTFARDALDGVPDEYRDAFVDGDDGVVRVAPEYARLVRFEKQNLAEPRRGDTENGRFDITWCRNVLIYFSAEARKRAIERLIASTAFGGTLFVGYSESLRDTPGLEAIRAGEAIYYVRRDPREVLRPSSPRTPMHGVPAIPRSAHTPPVGMPVAKLPDVLALAGQPDARALTAELAARLGEDHPHVVIDLDGAELLDDALAPVFRRATAAARAAGGEVVLRATRAGTQHWLVRHGLDREDSR